MKEFYLFIGDSSLSSKQNQFVVAVEEEAIDKDGFASNMLATRVAANSANRFLKRNEEKTRFINPYCEMRLFGWPVFVKVSKEWVLENMKFFVDKFEDIE